MKVGWLTVAALAACGSSGSLATDASLEGVSVDAGNCFGAGRVRTCLTAPPTMPLILDGNLDTTSDPRCLDDQGWCVIAGSQIQIITLRVTGTKPAVFVSTGAILVQNLDASSKRTGGLGPAANSSACIPPQTPSQAGGGPGGTFGGRGGDGGAGGLNSAEAGLVVSVTAFRGGCGGASGNGTNGGAGGASGGALSLISRARIDIEKLNASGAAGGGGSGGADGGGGGGSGGMVDLQAPVINVSGSVFANGGGGGEGGANGVVGLEPFIATNAALGGSANAGGDGGNGSAGTTKTGAKGADGATGGGGGGGAGVITIIPAQVTGGVLSPAPT